MFNAFKNKSNKSIQVTVGEDGIVLILCDNGTALTKLFVTSTEDKYTEKLKALLNNNPTVSIYLYLDNIDQAYVQRTLPGVASFNIKKMAQARLERETPKNYVKGCVQLSRHTTGRKDWIYTFVSTPLAPPISNWIDFFVVFPNVIKGIYFHPVETYAVIQRIKLLVDNSVTLTFKENFLNKFNTKKILKKSENSSKWELFVSQNKTGGFRQIAYQNGNVVFSRLLNNFSASTSAVIAGNIEFEIASSIEYLARLSIASNEQIDVYLVLAGDIIKCIRNEKIKANIYPYTPFQLAKSLSLKECAAEKDRFADPTILTMLSKISRKKLTLHTSATHLINRYCSFIDLIKKVLEFIMPYLALFILLLILNLISTKVSELTSQQYISEQNKQLADTKSILTSIEGKLDKNITTQHMVDLVNIFEKVSQNVLTPYQLYFELAKFLPTYTRVINFKWDFADSWLSNQHSQNSTAGDEESAATANIGSTPKLTAVLEVQMLATVKSFEELQRVYDNFTRTFKLNLSSYAVNISELPKSFNVKDINENKNIDLTITITKAYSDNKNFKQVGYNAD